MNPNKLRLTHLVTGVIFLLLTGVWGLYVAGAVEADNLRWLIPLPLVIGGGASLIALAAGGRRRS